MSKYYEQDEHERKESNCERFDGQKGDIQDENVSQENSNFRKR